MSTWLSHRQWIYESQQQKRQLFKGPIFNFTFNSIFFGRRYKSINKALNKSNNGHFCGDLISRGATTHNQEQNKKRLGSRRGAAECTLWESSPTSSIQAQASEIARNRVLILNSCPIKIRIAISNEEKTQNTINKHRLCFWCFDSEKLDQNGC